jgi:flagellin-specific chaperone FliS
MYQFEASTLLAPISYISGCISEWKVLRQLDGIAANVGVNFDKRVNFLKCVERLKLTATTLSMSTSVGVIERGFDDAVNDLAARRPLGLNQLQRLIAFGEKVVEIFVTEAEVRAFIVLDPKHSSYLEGQTATFGEKVTEVFGEAVQEISDAGRCRSFGMWTASVKHLMRAAETPLTSLATYLDVDVGQNWNTALNQIDAKLKERNKSNFNAEEEQWASEASAHLRAMKNAWRNHAQHGKARYNEEEAVSIWNNVQSFMQTLAQRLTN